MLIELSLGRTAEILFTQSVIIIDYLNQLPSVLCDNSTGVVLDEMWKAIADTIEGHSRFVQTARARL